jgi:hypothetical protein
MDILLENNTNRLLADFLEVENISFKEDFCEDRDIYFGRHIKRSEYYRKEDKISYTFPKYINCLFTKKGNRFGIKLKTKDFIVSEDYQYEKMDTVDSGDGMIRTEKTFLGKSKELLLPYLFIGNRYKIDTNKVVRHLKEILTNNQYV